MSTVDTTSSLFQVIREYGRPDCHIGAGEDESPWVPFVENVFIRHLAFDVRASAFANILWVKKNGVLGRHRHRGPVMACTLEGSWRYLEYDWVSRAGDYVHESPGVIHTSRLRRSQRHENFLLAEWLAGILRRQRHSPSNAGCVLDDRSLSKSLPPAQSENQRKAFRLIDREDRRKNPTCPQGQVGRTPNHDLALVFVRSKTLKNSPQHFPPPRVSPTWPNRTQKLFPANLSKSYDEVIR